jgi:hypothetical protein
MNVVILKTGNHGMSAKVHQPCPRTCESPYFGIAADCHKPVTSDGKCFLNCGRGIHCRNFSIEENLIGHKRGLLLSGQPPSRRRKTRNKN